jgi:exopolysaccharide production protein ExoZ
MQINGIQFLRFIAVFLVVGSHIVLEMWRRIGSAGGFTFWHDYGGIGVDIFFVISGFVITISTIKVSQQGGAAQAWLFCKRRIIRIVPMYWFYTAIKVALIVGIGSKAFAAGLEPGFVASSLLFWPTTNPAGVHLPVLESGWTLSYEMLFYASFALAIWRNWPPLRFSALALGAIFLLGQHAGAPLWLSFFGRTLLFEFLLGGVIAHLWVRKVPLHAAVAPAMLAIAVAMLFYVRYPDGTDRLLSVGLPSALLVASAVWLERYAVVSKAAGYFKLLGDASYSIYLSHGLIVPLVTIAILKAGVRDLLPVFCVAMAVALAIGCGLYLWLEQPVTRWLNSRFSAGKTTKPVTTPA